MLIVSVPADDIRREPSDERHVTIGGPFQSTPLIRQQPGTTSMWMSRIVPVWLSSHAENPVAG